MSPLSSELHRGLLQNAGPNQISDTASAEVMNDEAFVLLLAVFLLSTAMLGEDSSTDAGTPYRDWPGSYGKPTLTPIFPLVLSSGEEDHFVRTCWPGEDIVAKIELETLIELQMIAENVDDVDLHVAFCIDHTAWYEVLDEEVIRHHEPFLVTRQTQIMRPRVQTEVYDIHFLRLFRIRDVEHHGKGTPYVTLNFAG